MGAWNASINGNDTAQDLKSEYQAAFYYNDVETAVQKLDAYVQEELLRMNGLIMSIPLRIICGNMVY